MTLTFRTHCSGGELFGVGARAAGWNHVDGFEIKPKIAAVAKLNGFDVHAADVCRVDYAVLPPVDHLHTSPSCKRASIANVDAEEAPDDLAVAESICRAIAAHSGRTFSLENVYQYRTFESYARILAALQQHGFGVDARHVNAADFGVPQTRKRLIVRAVRGRGRVPPLNPTHREGGDMFCPPWIGWYEAIEDILDTLPETTPARWQLARMPKELRETRLFPSRESHDQHGNSYGIAGRAEDEPAQTPSTMSAGWYRAFLLHGTSTLEPRAADQPAAVCVATVGRKAVRPCAYLFRDDNTGQEWGKGYRDGDEPAVTVRTEGVPRAAIGGRWVRMTVQALGRFQTVPDDYQGLTAEINGNGVPPLLAQRIMESLRCVYE